MPFEGVIQFEKPGNAADPFKRFLPLCQTIVVPVLVWFVACISSSRKVWLGICFACWKVDPWASIPWSCSWVIKAVTSYVAGHQFCPPFVLKMMAMVHATSITGKNFKAGTLVPWFVNNNFCNSLFISYMLAFYEFFIRLIWLSRSYLLLTEKLIDVLSTKILRHPMHMDFYHEWLYFFNSLINISKQVVASGKCFPIIFWIFRISMPLTELGSRCLVLLLLLLVASWLQKIQKRHTWKILFLGYMFA